MTDQNMPKLNELDVFRMALIMHIARLAIGGNIAESEIWKLQTRGDFLRNMLILSSQLFVC